MDPLAHTLVGAALAETGLGRLSPRAGLVLIVGANLPDIDALAVLAGNDTGLLLRRGWTHGMLAMAVLPALLVGIVLWADRGRWRSDGWRAGPPHARTLLGLSYLAVLSHPALDWLNTYGVRLLMPFDGRWFYGDTLFIIDPWMWLLAASGPFLAHSATRRARAGWGLLALLTSLLLLLGPVPAGARAAWLAGLAALAAARTRGPQAIAAHRVARASLALLVVYIAAMGAGSRMAARRAARWLEERGVAVESVVANPLPARPLEREVVGVSPDAYYFVRVDALAPAPREDAPSLPRRKPGPVEQAALASPALAGTRGWLRLPYFQARRTERGWRVVVRDLRYARPGQTGFGVAVAELDDSLRPLPARPAGGR